MSPAMPVHSMSLALVVILAGPAALSACSRDARDQQGPLGLVQFGVGYEPDNVLASWFTVADHFGWFAAEGVDSEVKRVGTPLVLVQSGRLQCAQQTPAELLPFVARLVRGCHRRRRQDRYRKINRARLELARLCIDRAMAALGGGVDAGL